MQDTNIYIPKYELINQNTTIDFRTNGSYVPAHWHSALEITYLLNGRAEMTTEGNRHTMVKGEFIVVDSGRIHEFRCPQDYMQLVIHINDEYIASFMENKRNYQIICDRTELTEELVGYYLEICDALAELSQLCINPKRSSPTSLKTTQSLFPSMRFRIALDSATSISAAFSPRKSAFHLKSI